MNTEEKLLKIMKHIFVFNCPLCLKLDSLYRRDYEQGRLPTPIPSFCEDCVLRDFPLPLQQSNLYNSKTETDLMISLCC